MKKHELWHISSGISEIRELDLQEGKENQVLIESICSLISQGTERLVARGEIPRSIWKEMEVPYMEGSFGLPCKYGYSLAARVIEGPSEFKNTIVHLMHPHQDYAWVDTNSLFRIPDEIPPQRAVLAGNLETAVTAIWDSEISLGDSILVVGFGLIGALIGLLASGLSGVNVHIHEINENRRFLASRMGFSLFSPDAPSGFYDATFNTTSDEKGLQLCIDMTGNEKPVVDVSFYGTRPVTLMLGSNFHTGRKRIISSQVSRIPVRQKNHWNFLRRKQLVFQLLKNEKFDSVLGNYISFAESPDFFCIVRNGSMDAISAIIDYHK